MRKLILSNLVSADGLYEGPGNDLSWFKIDPEFHKQMVTIFDRVDTILIGRKTYEGFAGYWPGKTMEDDRAADFMNQSTKIVFSKTLSKAPWGKWEDGVIINDDIEKAVSSLKQQPGKDMVVFGSGSICTALSQADLIDEYRFIVNPVILGNGNQMFHRAPLNHPLKLKSVTAMSYGVVMLDYERDR